jgi:hypothetical protein
LRSHIENGRFKATLMQIKRKYVSTIFSLLASRNIGTIVLIGGSNLVANMISQMPLRNLNLFLDSGYAAMIPRTSVMLVAHSAILMLSPRYLYVDEDPGVKAVLKADQFGVNINFGLSENMSDRPLMDVAIFQKIGNTDQRISRAITNTVNTSRILCLLCMSRFLLGLMID